MMKRALISVFDKDGIIDFARRLHFDLGWELISTGGSHKILLNEGIPVKEVSEITNFPECLDGRVKTLHPKIEGGILGRRDINQHLEQMRELGMEPIDMVVCNLYPFKSTVLSPNVSHEEIIEKIDIGGPTMIRAAAKNYEHVIVITDPYDYTKVLDELEQKGECSMETKINLARKVFEHTSHYDTLVANYFNTISKNNDKFPETITFTYEKVQSLRYGENPHQGAAFYRNILGDNKGTITNSEKIQGKEISYNNIGDADGALDLLKEFSLPTIVASKHANPCGVATAETISNAFKKAYDADPVSIFGGIIASNREIDIETATIMNDIFLEVIIAPDYSNDALQLLSKKKNLRLLKIKDIDNKVSTLKIKSVSGGILLQESDDINLDTEQLKVVTDKTPTKAEMDDLLFAWNVVKHTKSNGIVIAKDMTTTGIGPGQVSRIWALENAIKQGGDKIKGSVLASDAFFPFSDSIEAAHKAGITAIIQPGGSIRDKESIDLANKYGISMIFTGIRHFKH